VVLPSDVVVAKEFKAGAAHRTITVNEVAADEMILDVGPKAVEGFRRRLENCATLVWNGPFGAFETRPFDSGTVAAARAVAERTKAGKLLSVAGGGDTVAALAHAGVIDDFTYVSTAGGAFLEWLEGQALPGVAALEEAAKKGRKR
jgi:phosphoglycerate kinase